MKLKHLLVFLFLVGLFIACNQTASHKSIELTKIQVDSPDQTTIIVGGQRIEQFSNES